MSKTSPGLFPVNTCLVWESGLTVASDTRDDRRLLWFSTVAASHFACWLLRCFPALNSCTEWPVLSAWASLAILICPLNNFHFPSELHLPYLFFPPAPFWVNPWSCFVSKSLEISHFWNIQTSPPGTNWTFSPPFWCLWTLKLLGCICLILSSAAVCLDNRLIVPRWFCLK